jgi:hypothetical protein
MYGKKRKIEEKNGLMSPFPDDLGGCFEVKV